MKEIERCIARYPGNCYGCGRPILVGDYVVIYELPMEKIVAKHITCVEDSGTPIQKG